MIEMGIRFTLDPAHAGSAKKVLDDLNISADEARKRVDLYSADYETISKELLDSLVAVPHTMPLFAEISGGTREDAMRYSQAIECMRIFIDRLTDYTDLECDDTLHYHDIEEDQFFAVISGLFVIQVLGVKAVYLDHQDYGFISADEMLYVLGAYIANLTEHVDSRVVGTVITEGGVRRLNVFEHHIHGDFRLSQYDLTRCNTVNPLDETEVLPFGRPYLIGSLAGYHSVESTFLVSLLTYIHYEQLEIDALKNFEHFICGVRANGQTYGPFGDAGMRTEGMEATRFIGFEEKKPLNIPMESSGHYIPVLRRGCLCFHLSGRDHSTMEPALTLLASDVEPVFVDLFQKVAAGNGRTSVAELENLLRYYEKKVGGSRDRRKAAG